MRRRGQFWRLAAPLAVGVAMLVLWEAVVRIENIPVYILPGPLAIG
jgi:NitT/TauT family transport system permease protein